MGLFADGIAGASSTEGTGAMTITANRDGFRPASQLTDGDQIVGTFRTAAAFETGLYTKSGGASPVFARTSVYMNISGTQAAVNWGAGEKEFVGSVSATVLPALNFSNIWTAHQRLRGFRLALDTDDDSYWYSDSDDNAVLVLNGVEACRMAAGAPNVFQLRHTDAGAAAGPVVRFDRVSSSPAANDVLAVAAFSGRNSAATLVDYGQIFVVLSDPAAGAEASYLTTRVQLAGASVEPLRAYGNRVAVLPNVNASDQMLLVGKSGSGIGALGVELASDGVIWATADGEAALRLNRLNSDGTLIDFQRDGVSVGSVSVASGVVTYGAFVGNHPTAFPDGMIEPPIGAVLCTIDQPFERLSHLPMVELSSSQGQRRVYGTYLGCETGDRLVAAVGAWQVLVQGPVAGGDLLWTSDVPGVAEAQPDDIVRAHTIGKVSVGDDQNGVRLVRAVLYCG